MLLCFSDVADKKRKIADSFRNSSYESKLSKVVKLIAAWVIDVFKDVLKRVKKKTNFFFAMIYLCLWKRHPNLQASVAKIV